jgi:hypothetical protein
MMWANRNGYFYVLDRVTGVPVRARRSWSQLVERPRRERTSDPDAAAAGFADWPSNQGGTNWYAVVQSADGPVLLLGVGKLRDDLPQGEIGLRAGPQFFGRRIYRAVADPRCADDRHRPPQSDQQLDE